MSRVVSFVVLLAVILIIGALFFRVMANFLLPLFLAALLVVIFRPLHRWILQRCRGRAPVAAGLTTATVLLIVLLPIALVITLAIFEGRDLVIEIQQTQLLDQKLASFRKKFDLEIPHAELLRAVDSKLQKLTSDPSNRSQVAPQIAQLGERIKQERDQLDTEAPEGKRAAQIKEQWDQFLAAFEKTNPNRDGAATDSDGDAAKETDDLVDNRPWREVALLEFRSFRRELLGGQVREWLKQMANPSETQLANWRAKGITYGQQAVLSIGGQTANFLVRLIFGGIITIVGLYFFLVDGPAMTKSTMRLSPLDDRHELELIAEFDRISRAVVVATLLAAVVQGLLAGIGYWFAGLESVFLLTLVTMVLAMVPFVGAAAVWMPVSLWLLVEGNYWAGGLLAVYGFTVVSAADNLIKPIVLHGQSQLHPLLALLSVLGGVQALGPIGIVVGPLVVAVLQTLLNILHRELTAFDEDQKSAAADPPQQAAEESTETQQPDTTAKTPPGDEDSEAAEAAPADS
ncbi:MAG: AI-2E family transporter [Planctomycetota bacterium]|nr:AI-2E family transporter [Planctomycetota bacterium]